MTPCLGQRGRCEGSGKRNCERATWCFWVGRGSLLAHDVNEAADALILKKLQGRKTRRAGVCSAAADSAPLNEADHCSCKTLTRGSARQQALQDQVTLQGPILRNHS
jgi:hypothetical protein